MQYRVSGEDEKVLELDGGDRHNANVLNVTLCTEKWLKW